MGLMMFLIFPVTGGGTSWYRFKYRNIEIEQPGHTVHLAGCNQLVNFQIPITIRNYTLVVKEKCEH